MSGLEAAFMDVDAAWVNVMAGVANRILPRFS
jgi:hypothetical protein